MGEALTEESRGLVTSRDGARIAYRTVGKGRDVVCVNGLSADDFYWRPIIPRLAEKARLTVWDLPGHGRSEPARRPDELSVEACAEDLGLVLDAIGAKEVVLLGFSLGCQIVLEAWRAFPERLQALGLILGTYERPFDGLLHPRFGPLLGQAISRLGPRSATLAMKGAAVGARFPGSHLVNRRMGFFGPGASKATMQPYIDHLASLDGPSWAGLAAAAQRHSAADLLGSITIPVLVVSGGRDVFTPPKAAETMAATIAGASHLHLPDAAHTGLVEHPRPIADAIEELVLRCGAVRAEGESKSSL